MPGCCIHLFSETDLAFCEKVKTNKREFPSAVERSLEDNTTPLLTKKTYQTKFTPTLRSRTTYFGLLVSKWGQLHIWDPDSKSSPLAGSSHSVPLGFSPNLLSAWSSVCGSHKWLQYAFVIMMLSIYTHSGIILIWIQPLQKSLLKVCFCTQSTWLTVTNFKYMTVWDKNNQTVVCHQTVFW